MTILFLLLLHPLLFLSIVFIWKNPTNWRKFLWMLVLELMLLAYSYEPTNNGDLIRYFQIMENISRLNFIEVIFRTDNWLYDNLFLINTIFWAISKTGLLGLLPAMTVGIVYGIAFYITCDCAERYNKIHSIRYLLLLQLMLLPFYNIINNIRNVIAFSLVLYALYREKIQLKNNINTKLLYISSCFIHPFALLGIGIRLITEFNIKIMIAAITFVLVVISNIETMVSKLSFLNSVPIINILTVKTIHYLSPDYSKSDWAIKFSTELFYRVNFWIIVAFSIIIFILFFKIYIIKNKGMSSNIDTITN